MYILLFLAIVISAAFASQPNDSGQDSQEDISRLFRKPEGRITLGDLLDNQKNEKVGNNFTQKILPLEEKRKLDKEDKEARFRAPKKNKKEYEKQYHKTN